MTASDLLKYVLHYATRDKQVSLELLWVEETNKTTEEYKGSIQQYKRIESVQSPNQKNMVYHGSSVHQFSPKKINANLIDVHANPVHNLSNYMKKL